VRRLVNPKQARLKTSPIGLLIGFVQETHLMSRSVNGGAHVFAYPVLADQPGLVEESNCTAGDDLDDGHDSHKIGSGGKLVKCD